MSQFKYCLEDRHFESKIYEFEGSYTELLKQAKCKATLFFKPWKPGHGPILTICDLENTRIKEERL